MGLFLAAVSTGCGATADRSIDVDGPEPTGSLSQKLPDGTVEQAVNSGACATSAVWGLSVQIIQAINCRVPGAFSEIPAQPNLVLSDAVFAYLQTPARDALVAALQEHPGTELRSSSIMRTVAQQYLLYAWYQQGSCGIPLAARPGHSNHEGGLAVDVSNYGTWRDALEAHGFHWYGSDDIYHYDYQGAGAQNLTGEDVLAFQRLWNLNHPEDLIDEDGDYGPQTEARLKQSPADGFPNALDCSEPPPGPEPQPEAGEPEEASSPEDAAQEASSQEDSASPADAAAGDAALTDAGARDGAVKDSAAADGQSNGEAGEPGVDSGEYPFGGAIDSGNSCAVRPGKASGAMGWGLIAGLTLLALGRRRR